MLSDKPVCVSTTGLWQSEIVPFKLQYDEPETSIKIYNFVGNYTWIRAYISRWVGGTINSIKMNH